MQLPPLVQWAEFEQCREMVLKLARHCCTPVDPDKTALEITAAFSAEGSGGRKSLAACARSWLEPFRIKTETKRVRVGNVEYTLTDCVRDNERVLLSFDRLAEQTFGISFLKWRKDGYWGSSYRPRVLLYGGEVVANVSVNLLDVRWQGRNLHLVQLGTVMTRPEFQGRGLSRCLMESVIGEWEDWCDAFYLFANDSVLDFYPRFGFSRVPEYQYTVRLPASYGRLRKLDMGRTEDIRFLLERYRMGNPFSSLSVDGNEGLLMFYCSQFLKDCVYCSDEYGLVFVAEFEQDRMTCYDVFGTAVCSLGGLLGSAAPEGIRRVTLGFPPVSAEGMEQLPLRQEDTTLFVRDEHHILPAGQWMFPLLSHA